MAVPGETEAGSAGTQPCRGIAWWAHRDDADERGSQLSRSPQNHIGSKDPHALKIPARRAECSLTENARTPFQAEPGQVNLRHFSEVGLRTPGPKALSGRAYNRMNDDYRLLHDLCRLFLANRAITEDAGDWRFRGFRLDMNELFERFVTEAFWSVAKSTCLTAHPQKEDRLSQPPSAPIRIRPDVTLCEGVRTAAVVDAKYKRTEDKLANHDLYQAIAYGTALQCNRVYLLYPATECDADATIQVRHSPIAIHVRRIDIGDPRCVSHVEQAARTILGEAAEVPPAPIR